jgi:HprK-related kinase A
VKVFELTESELKSRLAGPGLFLIVGPFVFQIQTRIAQLALALRRLYDQFQVADDPHFADFHIRFGQSLSWRDNLRRHVWAEVNGDRPSLPVRLEQAYAVFEGCLNWCIYTRAYQYLIIHAAAVERTGRAAILPAPPGSGKSTLCAALVNRGWRLLTDELTLIDVNGRTIVPLARPISLKNQSIDIIGRFAPDAVLGPISPNTIKGTIAHLRPPAESVARAGEQCSPAWLIVPQYHADRATSVRPVAKTDGFMRIAASAVNYMALGQPGFEAISALVDNMRCYRLEYSDLDEAVRWFEALSADDYTFAIEPAAT